MYLLKRTTKIPASPMRVLVAESDGVDAGLGDGGTFYFQPDGDDGSEYTVTEHVAQTIMEDPELAKHFSCTPPCPPSKKPKPQAHQATTDRHPDHLMQAPQPGTAQDTTRFVPEPGDQEATKKPIGGKQSVASGKAADQGPNGPQR